MIITYLIKKKNIKRRSLVAFLLMGFSAGELFAAEAPGGGMKVLAEAPENALRSSGEFRGVSFARKEDEELGGAYKESRAHRGATSLQQQVNDLAQEHRTSTQAEVKKESKDLQALNNKRLWFSSLSWGVTTGGSGFAVGLVGLRLSQNDSVMTGLGAGAAATFVSYKLLNENRQLRIEACEKRIRDLNSSQIRSEQIAANGDGIHALDITMHELDRRAYIDRRNVAQSTLSVPARDEGVGIKATNRERVNFGNVERAWSWLPSAEFTGQAVLTGGVIGALLWHASQK